MFQLTFGDQELIVPAGASIDTLISYLNVDCLVLVTPYISIPLTDNVLVPSTVGRNMSLPLFAQLTVEVDWKLSYE